MLNVLKFQVFGFQGHFFAFLVALATENDDNPLGGGVRPHSESLRNCRRDNTTSETSILRQPQALTTHTPLVEAHLCSVQMGSLDQAMHRDGLAKVLVPPAAFPPPQKL